MRIPRVLSGWRWPLAAACVAVGGSAVAQEREGLTVVRELSLTQTLTDNYQGPGSVGGRSESITSISPGLRISSRSGRVVGSLDYALNGLIYGRDSQASNVQHRLAANGRGELIPGHLDLNLAAAISRQPRSAFDLQSADGSLTDRNQAEVRRLSVQPVLYGNLGGWIAARAVGNASATDGGSEAGTRGRGLSLSLAPARSGGLVGWGLEASRQITDFEGGRRTTNDRFIASVVAQPDVDLQLGLRVGTERSDLASLDSRRFDNWGASLRWTPSPRTRVALDGDRREFGNAHSVSVEHRMRRSVLRFTDTRSLNDGRTQSGGTMTAYDLFFELFAAQEPDPVAREALVREFLEQNGVNPDAVLGGGFLTSAITLQRRQELSLALTGQRTTFVVSTYRTDTERADPLSSGQDDLLGGPVHQRGLGVTVAHRLTPVSSLTLGLSSQRTRGGVGAANGLDSVQLGWVTRLNDRSNLSLTVRHSEYEDQVDPYTENAVLAAFSRRF